MLCQYAGPNLSELDHLEHHQKIPLTAYGRPGLASVVANLVQRQWAQLNLFRSVINSDSDIVQLTSDNYKLL